MTNAETAELQAELDSLRAQVARLTRETPARERDAMMRAQARADSVGALFGERAPEPALGDTSLAYRRKLAARLQRHSPRFKGENLAGLGDASLASVEDHIYADAIAAARDMAGSVPGKLVAIQELDPAGRLITRFNGDPLAWMAPFMTGAICGSINRVPGPDARGSKPAA